jgi:drug/metabolite transporter (DMT)-like permease
VGIDWTPKLAILLFISSTFGTVLPYWGVASAGRRLSAGAVALGLLATPVLGILSATFALGEAPDAVTWAAVALVIGGVLVGTRGAGTTPAA